MFYRLYGSVILLLCLLESSCILSESTKELWLHGTIDENLIGTWDTTVVGITYSIQFQDTVTNMLCIITIVSSDGEAEHEIKLHPLACRSVKIEESDVRFLVLLNSYNSLAEYFGAVFSDNMDTIFAYNVNDADCLNLYFHDEQWIRQRIQADVFSGRFFKEGDDQFPHVKSLLKNPSLQTVGEIAIHSIQTNAPSYTLSRRQGFTDL